MVDRFGQLARELSDFHHQRIDEAIKDAAQHFGIVNVMDLSRVQIQHIMRGDAGLETDVLVDGLLFRKVRTELVMGGNDG